MARTQGPWVKKLIVRFMEECDAYYYVTYSKEDALKVISELKEWIESI